MSESVIVCELSDGKGVKCHKVLISYIFSFRRRINERARCSVKCME